jgi:hypothetical protein
MTQTSRSNDAEAAAFYMQKYCATHNAYMKYLDKTFAIIDERRGKILALRKEWPKGSEDYRHYSTLLRLLNGLKKEFALVSDADQLPLGL